MKLEEAMGEYLHDTALSRKIIIRSLTFYNKWDKWMLIVKIQTFEKDKRVSFTTGRTPKHCMQIFMKAWIAKTVYFKEDTPYQPPIDDK